MGLAGVDVFPNEAIARVEPKTASLDKRFLALWLAAADLLPGAGRAVKGNTLNSTSLRAIPVSYPPLAEQRRIVDLVAAVDALRDPAVEVQRQVRALMDAVAEAVFGDDGMGQLRRMAELLLPRHGLSYGVLKPGLFAEEAIVVAAAGAVAREAVLEPPDERPSSAGPRSPEM